MNLKTHFSRKIKGKECAAVSGYENMDLWSYVRALSGSINRKVNTNWERWCLQSNIHTIPKHTQKITTNTLPTHAIMLKQKMEYLMLDIWFSNLAILAPWPSPFPAMSLVSCSALALFFIALPFHSFLATGSPIHFQCLFSRLHPLLSLLLCSSMPLSRMKSRKSSIYTRFSVPKTIFRFFRSDTDNTRTSKIKTYYMIESLRIDFFCIIWQSMIAIIKVDQSFM